MSAPHRVVWSQGLYLQPHHFQQEARHVAHALDARVQATFPYGWGFRELVLDESQLSAGRVAVLRASGVLPDGTAFSIPDVDVAPAAYAVPADLRGERVVLALPRARSGVTEVDFGDGAELPLARYRVVDDELRDHTHASDEPEPVQLAAPRLVLMRARDAGEAFAALAIAQVAECRADRQVVLERGYIAAQTRIDATAQLDQTTQLVHGLVAQRAKLLASALGQLGKGVSEVADFLTLHLLNRAEPLLRQYAGAPSVHPWPLYLALVQLAGELATFSRPERIAREYPIYRHDDLHAVFEPVVLDLRAMLSTVLQRHAVQIELTERGHGVRTAVVQDQELLQSAGFVLAVRAQLPAEQLRQRVLTQTKLGPAEKLRDLVNLQLPGVTLRNLPVAPRQLPFHAGSHYFELERQGEHWKHLERTGSLALHVAGDIPGLELELWAVRAS